MIPLNDSEKHVENEDSTKKSWIEPELNGMIIENSIGFPGDVTYNTTS